MIRNLDGNRILWLLVALLSLFTATIGFFHSTIYDGIVSQTVLPGVLAQDFMTIIAALVLFILTFRSRKESWKNHIIILGILGFLFYAYGIYTIERLYNPLYFIYMAIFGLSFYAIIYGIINLGNEKLCAIKLPKTIRIVSVCFLLLNPLIFYPLWISQLLPLIQTGQKIEFFYSIYILDLCFIMPLFVILAFKTAKNEGTGLLLTPALFVLGFTLLAPLALVEMLKPVLFKMPTDMAGMGLFLSLSILFIIMTFICFRYLELSEKSNKKN